MVINRLFHITLMIVISSCFSTVKSQCKSSKDSILYTKAYDYVVNDSLFDGLYLNVSDKLVGTNYLHYTDEIKKDTETYISAYKRLYDFDEKYASIDTIYPYFKQWFKEYKNFDALLFFSKIIENSVFVSVRRNDDWKRFLEVSIYYYIIFDSDNNIEKVYKHEAYGI